MIYSEEFYFEPSSTDENTECYIWFASSTDMNDMSNKGYGYLFRNHKPISELKKYLATHPKHTIHASAFEELSKDAEKLKKYLEENDITYEGC